jgi:hypothetical protein
MIALALLEAVIDASGVPPRIEAALPIGVRRRQLTVRTLLAGMCLAQADHRPAHLTRVHQALTGLPPDEQWRLGVIADWKNGPHQLTYRQTERTFGLVTGTLGKDQPDGLPSRALQALCDDLLEASIPEEFKDASTSLAVDWTDLESFSRPPPRGTRDCADPQASWGHRKNNLLRSEDELFYGYYFSAGIMMPEENGPAVPELARRATVSSCRKDPVRAFAPVLTAMPAAGIPLGDILDDSGYAHRDADAWALPLRAAGAQLVQDLHPHDLFRINFCPFYSSSNDLMERRKRLSPGIADGWHSEVGGSGAAVAFDAPVEAGEFAFSGVKADLEALDFAEPAVHPCFGDAFVKVADDVGEAGPLLRRHAEHRASQACMFMLAS